MKTPHCRTVLGLLVALATPHVALAQFEQPIDACTLLSYDRIETLTGARPKAANSSPSAYAARCSWTVDNPYPNYPVVSLTVTATGEETWEAFTAGLVAGEMEDFVRRGERVDVGRFGLYDDDLLMVVTLGGSTIMLTVNPPFRPKTGRAGVLALSRTVLERLAGEAR